jgi:hypothetical protein
MTVDDLGLTWRQISQARTARDVLGTDPEAVARYCEEAITPGRTLALPHGSPMV